jgi:hypothetical protein
MFIKERMKKDKKFQSTRHIMERTRNGRSSILTKLLLLKPRDLMKNSDFTSTDHSTSSQDSHSEELLKEVDLMCTSEDGLRTERHNNGTSMKSPRLSDLITGRTIASKSKQVDHKSHSE